MSKPWCERQREALHAFRKAIEARAQRERALIEGIESRTPTAEECHIAEKKRVENEYAVAQAEAVTHAEQSRRRMQALHDEQRAQIEREHKQAKDKIEQDYQKT